MDYASGTALLARQVARSVGITRGLVSIYRRIKPGYEQAFSRALRGAVRVGDTVWDVGANVGYYTKDIAHLVGRTGRVIAFEPAPATLATLRSAVTDLRNVQVVGVALSRENGAADFFADASGGDSNGGLLAARPAQTCTKVAVRAGDAFLQEFPPNVIKIDVEGFELDVLQGMPATLQSPALRAVFIEVHFDVLSRRGQTHAPGDLAHLLRAAGFAVRWPDASHIAATRGPGRTPNQAH